MISSKTQLAIELSKLQTFSDPKSELEQYTTDSEIAASILWKCYMDNKLSTIADFGSGTGILGFGAALLGAEIVYLIEKDIETIKIAKQNQVQLEKKFGKLPIVYVNKDIYDFKTKIDTVIMNPPFGVQNEHADKVFLEQAMKIANNIYSLHKIESKEFIDKLAEKNNYRVQEILEFNFPLKPTMQYHKQKVRKIRVGCWVLVKI